VGPEVSLFAVKKGVGMRRGPVDTKRGNTGAPENQSISNESFPLEMRKLLVRTDVASSEPKHL
jgi:hypothetical protein